MKAALAPTAVALLLLSCGVYTFSPSAAGGIKTIAIPLPENQTTEYGLPELLSRELSQVFVADNTLKVVPEVAADGKLEVIITRYSRDAYTFSAGEEVQEYSCKIDIKAQLLNLKSDKVIWSENLSDFGIYSSSSETEEDGKLRAIEKLVNQVLNKTVKGW